MAGSESKTKAKTELKQPKKFVVDFSFPELMSGKMYQSAVVEASNMGMALLRAFQEVRTRDGVKKKQIHNAKVVIGEMTSSS